MLLRLRNRLGGDHLLVTVLKNSAYLFSSTTIGSGLAFFQGILSARLLGMYGLGVVTAITLFASNVNRLLSFRMNEVVVKFLGEALENDQRDQAAALIKGTAMIEIVTSLLAYLILVLLAPWAALTFAKDSGTSGLFMLYGLILIPTAVHETATGVLQATCNFQLVARVNVIHSIVITLWMTAAFVRGDGLPAVLLAYIVGKTVVGLGMAWAAWLVLNERLGVGWLKTPLSAFPAWATVRRFALSTNFQVTVTLVARDSEPLFINWLLSPVEGGFYKIAFGLLNLILMPIDPLIAPIYTELIRAIAHHDWTGVRRLLRRTSVIAGIWVLAAAGGMAALGYWIIPLLYGAEARPAFPAFLILVVGLGFNGLFPWQRSLLLAFGLAGFPTLVMALAGMVKTALTVWLLPLASLIPSSTGVGYLVESAILSGFYLVITPLIVWRGLLELSRRTAQEGSP